MATKSLPITHGHSISQQVNILSPIFFLIIKFSYDISGAFASMISYYAKLMRRIPIPSVGAVRLFASAFFHSLLSSNIFLCSYIVWSTVGCGVFGGVQLSQL